MIEAITFDFWNTLYKIPTDAMVASRRAHKFCEVLHEGGYRTSVYEVSRAIKECWKRAHFFQRVYGRDITPTGHINFILGWLLLDVNREIWDKVYQVYTNTLVDIPPRLNDDVKETLPLLADKYKLAVICNTGVTPGVILRSFLKNDNISDYFEVVVFSDEVLWAKPDVKIFNYVLENIKVENTSAVHIGDDPLTDIIGAKKAGMKAVWLAPHASWAVPECDYHVQSVKELVSLF